jgi:pyrroline-5-carboxylate reductase
MGKVDSVAFIGGGRVARILLEGWKLSGTTPASVRVVEPDDAALRLLTEVAPQVEAANLDDIGNSDLVFLAVHPPQMTAVLTALAGKLGPKTIVVSLAPKLVGGEISAALGTQQWVRMIPNAPSAIGAGYNPICFGEAIDPEAKDQLKAFFSPLGEQPEVAEEHLEAYAVITAMGPTYFWYQIEALRELAVSFGLNQEAADEAISKMLGGAVRCLLTKGPESMDLIPVRPLESLESTVKEAYETKLKGIFSKLTG